MEENKKHSLGAIPSPFDYRDAIATAAMAPKLAAVTLPVSYQSEMGKDLNQKIEPACAAHDVVYAIRLAWFKKTGEWVDFSPRFLDTLVKRYDKQDRATGGTYIRMLMQLVCNFGCATTATLPNDTSLPTLQYRNDALLTAAVMAEAAKYKWPGYFGVPTDKQSGRAAIYLHGAICMGAEISNEWFANKGEPLPVPKNNADVAGGHATTGKGFQDATYNTLRNQWGVWGLNGTDEAPYDPTAFAPYVFELWAFADIPGDVLDFLKVLPSPANFHYQWNTTLVQGMEVVGAIDFSGLVHGVGAYATDPLYAEKIATYYSAVEVACGGILSATALDAYIKKIAPSSPVTAAMIISAAQGSNVDALVLAAVLQNESAFGTLGAGAHTMNPGNVGNVDSGATHSFGSWQLGVNACSAQLARRQMPGETDDVRYLQIALMILGFLAPLAANEFGIYGAKTATAVGQYQKAHKISPVPGSVGPQTRTALNAEFTTKIQ